MPKALECDWKAIESAYRERPEATLQMLGKEFGVNWRTINRYANRHGWRKRGAVTLRATGVLTRAAEKSIDAAVEKVAAKVVADAEQTLADLRPWIEEQRVKHVKNIVGLSQRGLKRLEDLYERAARDPKAESFTATAMDRLDQISRRNLGMGDSGGSNTLNLGVLTSGGRTVVQISTEPTEKQADVKEIEQ